MKDIYHDLLVVKTIDPVLGKTTQTGAAVDLQGFEGALMAAHVGQSGDTLSGSIKMTVSFQESDTTTSGDFANVAAADLLGGANDVVIDDEDKDEIVVTRGYLGSRRYVRILVTYAGTHTNGTPISAVVIKGLPRHAPVA